MIGWLLIAYWAVGYRLFWAGIDDEFAHIPRIAILRVIQAFTWGPALLFIGFVAGSLYDRNH